MMEIKKRSPHYTPPRRLRAAFPLIRGSEAVQTTGTTSQNSDGSSEGNTPVSCYQYDTSSVSEAGKNLVGHLTNAWTQAAGTTCSGAPTAGSYLALKSYLAYDVMGRSTKSRQTQCTSPDCTGFTPYTSTLEYDLLGNLTQFSIPEINSGTTYLYTYDVAGRLSSISSSWADSSSHPATLFSAASYGPLGLVAANYGIGGSGSPIISATRVYDKTGRSVSESDTANEVVVSSATGSKGYIVLALGEQSTQIQNPSATKSTGTITISGSELSITSDPSDNEICVVKPTLAACQSTTVYDIGTISLTIGSHSFSVVYRSTSTAASIASSLAASLNASGSPVTATVSGSTISLTSSVGGSTSNYTMAVTISNGDSDTFPTPSFKATLSASQMTGGTGASTNTVYDSGTITSSINGITSAPVPWSNSSSSSGVAGLLANAINKANGSTVTATVSENTITLNSISTGSTSNLSVSTSITYDNADFSSSSLAATVTQMTGGTDAGIEDNAVVYSYNIPDGGYDGVGNLLSVTDSVTGKWTYGYDTLNRMTSATPYTGNAGCWAYDAFGNRTAEDWQGDCGSVAQTATYNSKNQITWTSVNSAAGGLYYDAAGNVTNDSLNTYLYDAEGRVCAVKNEPVSGTWAMIGYIYDAEGHRTAKGTLSGWSCDSTKNGFAPTLVYVLGPTGEQFAEFDGSGNWQHTNVFANGKLLATYLASDNDTHFALTDWLGTKRAEMTSQGLLSTFYSKPFGNDQATGGAGYDATEHHFTGKERDTESGNDYFGARYYASSMGRFLSPDWGKGPVPYATFTDPQSLNLYAYVRNNPLSRNDPNGHCDWCQRVANFARGDGFVTNMNLKEHISTTETYSLHGAPHQYAGDHYMFNAMMQQGGGSFVAANTVVQTATKAYWGTIASTVAAPIALETLSSGAALSVVPEAESTTAQYFHYGYLADAEKFAGGLRPGSFATTTGDLTGAEAQSTLALPHPTVPDAVYPVTPEPGTPINGPSMVEPQFGQPGGGQELTFPQGTGPGTVGPPTPIPPQ